MRHQHRLLIQLHLSSDPSGPDQWHHRAWATIVAGDRVYEEAIELPGADPSAGVLPSLSYRDRELVKRRLFHALATSIDDVFPVDRSWRRIVSDFCSNLGRPV
jgi:hypothetical protein